MNTMRERRLERGMSQVQLAAAIGTTQGAVARFEKGTRQPKPSTAKKIADVLGFSWTEFYEDKEEK